MGFYVSPLCTSYHLYYTLLVLRTKISYEKSWGQSFFYFWLDIPLIVELVNYSMDYLVEWEFLDSLKTAPFY